MNELEQRVTDQIEQNWEGETSFLQGLVQRPSTLGNEARVQQFIADELSRMGLEVDVWQIDHAEISREPGYSPVEWSYEGRPNVATTWRGSGDGRSLLLNGHIDVVPATPEHHWIYDPWGGEIKDGRMYGRGAADMKSGVAAMIYAVRALREVGVDLKGSVTLETVIEEECTGNGALAARTRGYNADATIIPEPLNKTALVAQVGVMWARITVKGKGAHAERASGAVNAIGKTYLMIQAVEELESLVNAEERPEHFRETEHPLNYNTGVIRGGDWASSVPEECSFEVRISAYPGEDLGEVRDRFKSHLLEAAKADPWLSENPPEISFYAFLAEGCTIDREAEIFDPLRKHHRNLMGSELESLAFTGTTDARFFNLYNDTPATCYGPVGGGLHAPDEWVDLDSVKNVTKVLALTVMDWCGVATP